MFGLRASKGIALTGRELSRHGQYVNGLTSLVRHFNFL
jgi:hypothetical protein